MSRLLATVCKNGLEGSIAIRDGNACLSWLMTLKKAQVSCGLKTVCGKQGKGISHPSDRGNSPYTSLAGH